VHTCQIWPLLSIFNVQCLLGRRPMQSRCVPLHLFLRDACHRDGAALCQISLLLPISCVQSAVLMTLCP
jgi:hypothetical protein